MCSRGLRRGGRDSPRARGRPESPPLYAYVLDADDDLAEELDVRMRRRRASARHRASARCRARRVRPRAVVPRRRARPRAPDPRRPGRRPHADRRPHRDRAARVGRPAPADGAPDRRDGRAGHDVAGAASHTVRAAGRGVRAAGAAVAPDRARPAAPGRAAGATTSTRCGRSRASRGSRCAWCCSCGTSPRAGAGSSRPACALSLPLTHRLLGQLVAAERPSVSHALARLAQAGLVTGAPGDWHLHGKLDEHLGSLIERTRDRAASSARTAPWIRDGPHEHVRSAVLWITSGLGCDGDSIAMTSATNPTLEDLLRGSLPGDAADRALQPGVRVRDGRRLHAGLVRRRSAASSTRSSSCSRARCRTRRSAATGTGPAMGVDRETGQPILTNSWIDRLAPAGRGGARTRHVRRIRRDPGDAEQPDRRDGPRRLPGRRTGRRGSACPS